MNLNPQMMPGESDADFCRRMGIAVGDFLAGNDGYMVSAIKITGIGEEMVLARVVSRSHGIFLTESEIILTLRYRNWFRVAGPQAYFGA